MKNIKTISANRLKIEYKEIEKNPKLKLELDEHQSNICYVYFQGEDKTLYENENFKLKFEFEDNYPLQKPSVTFVNHIPINPFVFSNGLICLNILDTDWSPTLKVSSVILSILSMLSSTKEKRRPVNDEFVCKSGFKNFNEGNWRHNYVNI